MPSAHLPVPAQAFLGAGEVVLALAGHPAVERAWADESACEGMTVGGLSHHLVAQIVRAAELLGTPPPVDAPVIGLLDHYDRAPWVEASRRGELDLDQNVGDNEAAAQGQVKIVADGQSALEHLKGSLGPTRPSVVHIPWQGWSLPTDAFLTTRLMEMVVHSDDLAASVGVDTPEFDESVTGPVLGLLVRVAARRHGQGAVVRTLSRPRRASGAISAF